MKRNLLSFAIITILVLCFDILSLIYRKDFDVNFWFGFVNVQISLGIYAFSILVFNENKDGQRGIKPIEFICVCSIIVMVIMGIVCYAIPTTTSKILAIPYIILYTCMLIGIALGVYNKQVIDKQSK